MITTNALLFTSMTTTTTYTLLAAGFAGALFGLVTLPLIVVAYGVSFLIAGRGR